MRFRRRLPILLAVVLVAAAVALLVFLRKHAPPEPARLLPSADGFVYVNLRWIRRANIGGQLPAVSHDPEYQQFIEATGFQFERDLEEAAFAIHYAAEASGKKPAQPRFSEVFIAKIQGDRLRAYLQKISGSVENYRSVDIYSIPLEGRTLRVAILGVDTVAASNHDDPLVIHGIVDRSRKMASPFGGPALLRQSYKYVPFASLAWAIFKVDPSASMSGPLNFILPPSAVVVASIRYLGTVHFKAEAFTASEDDAKRLTEQLTAFLKIFQSMDITVPAQGSDPDIKQLFDNLKVEQHKDRAVLTTTVPPGFIRKALAEPPKPSDAPPAENPPSSTNNNKIQRK
jgi:hypothetical protein